LVLIVVCGAQLEQDEDGSYHGQGHHEQRLDDVRPRDVGEQDAAVLYGRRSADGSETQRPQIAGVILLWLIN
jgi:hypothetical protein